MSERVWLLSEVGRELEAVRSSVGDLKGRIDLDRERLKALEQAQRQEGHERKGAIGALEFGLSEALKRVRALETRAVEQRERVDRVYDVDLYRLGMRLNEVEARQRAPVPGPCSRLGDVTARLDARGIDPSQVKPGEAWGVAPAALETLRLQGQLAEKDKEIERLKSALETETARATIAERDRAEVAKEVERLTRAVEEREFLLKSAQDRGDRYKRRCEGATVVLAHGHPLSSTVDDNVSAALAILSGKVDVP